MTEIREHRGNVEFRDHMVEGPHTAATGPNADLPSPSTRVLIRTLPLSSNYGGILQAYALQQALRDLGLCPFTDLSTANAMNPLIARGARMVARMLPAWAVFSKRAMEFRNDMLDEAASRPLTQFVEQHIAGVRLYGSRGSVDARVLQSFDKVVVGSDQVWRHGYGDVKSYLADFVDDPGVRVISYAASFGRDDLQGYDDAMVAATRVLAQRFTAVSVREASAVGLCEKHWQVGAVQHVDPTMLLTRSAYGTLAARDGVGMSPECLTYVLDESPETMRLVGALVNRLGMVPTPLIRKPPSHAAWRRDPHLYARPSVPTWLRAFTEAEFVITDSFHGTVFAILNNKPFIAIANEKRGVSRFESLLTMFGLRDRLVTTSAGSMPEIALPEPDWRSVERMLVSKRAQAREYLRATLVGE